MRMGNQIRIALSWWMDIWGKAGEGHWFLFVENLCEPLVLTQEGLSWCVSSGRHTLGCGLSTSRDLISYILTWDVTKWLTILDSLRLAPRRSGFTWTLFSLAVGAGLRFPAQSQWPKARGPTWWSVLTETVSLKRTKGHLPLIIGQSITDRFPSDLTARKEEFSWILAILQASRPGWNLEGLLYGDKDSNKECCAEPDWRLKQKEKSVVLVLHSFKISIFCLSWNFW